ncbi:MAG: hypothetical protein COV75_07720 [Candidatus Omnitrophica bacterium CG11_big_fil_rev_8_21_14_0_20_63_9]|nr:MAG: hypothetical protein COV75_07720 [Candidatus Omnitrophica bacterium CG11_big_fil_rev_8_21_14_0_20_63_9]
MPTKRPGRYWAYLLQCADGTYYAGSTNDVAGRIRLHNAGRGAKYVRGRAPASLVYMKRYHSCSTAMAAEWRLKRLTRREKMRLALAYKRVKHGAPLHY